MWRALAMAIAITLCILGLECMVINKAVMMRQVPAPTVDNTYSGLDPLFQPAPADPQMINRVIQPPDWAAWSLLAAGVVVMLHAMSLTRDAS